MKKLSLTAVIILSLTALACSSNSEVNENEIAKDASDEVTAVIVPDSPCEWINSDDIRNIIGVADAYEISQEAKDYTYPACSFRWEDKKVVKHMTVAGREMTVDMPSEVMVVLAKDIDAAKFERSVAVYEDGEVIDGVGDQAMWGDKMSQLTFRKGSLLLHVHVKVANETSVNKAKALEIADFLIKKM